MKKYGLLLTVIVVLLSSLAACSKNEPVNGDDYSDSASERSRSSRAKGLFSLISSSNEMSASMENLDLEIIQRLETTPLQAVGMLLNSLEYGTTTVDFTYLDTRYGDSARGNVSFVSDLRNNDFAVIGDVTIDDQNVDFSAYLNNDRLAIGSNMIGGTYGIDFNTLSRDIEQFTNNLGIDMYDLGIDMDEFDMLTDMYDEYFNMFRDLPSYDVLAEPFTDLLMDFQLYNEQVSRDVEIMTSAGTVNAKCVSYTLNATQFTNLLRDLVTAMENDGTFAEMYENALYEEIGVSPADIFYELRNGIREIEREFGGSLTISCYTDTRDRLIRLDIDGVFSSYGDEMAFNVVCDFGDSATDVWRIDATATNRWDTASASFVWNIREQGDSYINEINVMVGQGNYLEGGTLTCDWNTSSGQFILSAAEGSWYEELLRGNFTTSNGTFNLNFNVSQGREEITVGISTSDSANIGNINYTNIADITMEMVERMELFGGVQRNARMASNRDAAVTMAQTFNNYNACVATSQAITTIPFSNNGVWSATVPPLIPGGDPLFFSVAFHSGARFNQVGGWLIYNNGVWQIDNYANFDVQPAN